MAGSLVHERILRQVKAMLTEEERLNRRGWYYPRSRQVIEDYRRLCPSGRLPEKARNLFAISVAVIGLATWAWGFPIADFLSLEIIAVVGLFYWYH